MYHRRLEWEQLYIILYEISSYIYFLTYFYFLLPLKQCAILVPDDTVHMVTNYPPFGTQDISTFDIAISSYTITPFYSFFYLFYTTGISKGKGLFRGYTETSRR